MLKRPVDIAIWSYATCCNCKHFNAATLQLFVSYWRYQRGAWQSHLKYIVSYAQFRDGSTFRYRCIYKRILKHGKGIYWIIFQQFGPLKMIVSNVKMILTITRKFIVGLNDKSVSVAATLNSKCIWITTVRSLGRSLLSALLFVPRDFISPAAAMASPLIWCGSQPQLILSNSRVWETNDGRISSVKPPKNFRRGWHAILIPKNSASRWNC